MSDFHAIFKVTPGLQSYEWGKKGSDSLAAQMAKECVEGFEVDENKEYAEVCTRRRSFHDV
jgi:mannose-6-phosphate isomerase